MSDDRVCMVCVLGIVVGDILYLWSMGCYGRRDRDNDGVSHGHRRVPGGLLLLVCPQSGNVDEAMREGQ